MNTTAPVKKDRKNLYLLVIGGLIVVLGLAFFASPYASSSPDGLERVAIDKGFAESAEDHTFGDGPLADYGVEGVEDEKIATGLAGVVGVAITFGAAMIIFGLIRTLKGRGSGDQEGSPAAA